MYREAENNNLKGTDMLEITPIGRIKWPENETARVNVYLSFLIKITNGFSIDYSQFDYSPVKFTSNYMETPCLLAEINICKQYWWEQIEKNEGMRDFSDTNVLKARIALLFFEITDPSDYNFGECISWLMTFLKKLLGSNYRDQFALIYKEHFFFF